MPFRAADGSEDRSGSFIFFDYWVDSSACDHLEKYFASRGVSLHYAARVGRT